MVDISNIRDNGRTITINYNDGTSVLGFKLPNGRYRTKGATVKPVVNDNPNPNGGKGTFTAEMITAACNGLPDAAGNLHNINNALWDAQTIANMFNDAIKAVAGSFTSQASRAALVGECASETDGFKTMQEYVLSDPPYGGYGMIQLTHKGNFQAFGNWCYSNGYTNDASLFVNNPELVKTQQWAAVSAVYYFTQATVGNDMNCAQWADYAYSTHAGDWHEVSRAINRGNALSPYAAYAESQRDAAINACMAVTPAATGGSGTSGDSGGSKIAQRAQQFHDKWIGTGIDYDGAYGFQCYDLANQWSYELYGAGHLARLGYAMNLAGSGDGTYWQNVAGAHPPQPGDLLVWTWAPAGHVALCMSADDSTIKAFQQDGSKNDGWGAPAEDATYGYSGYFWGSLRPAKWIADNPG